MIEFQQEKELQMNITESEVEDGFVIEPLYYGGKTLAGKGYYKDDVLVKVVKQYDNPYDDSKIYKLYNKHEDIGK